MDGYVKQVVECNDSSACDIFVELLEICLDYLLAVEFRGVDDRKKVLLSREHDILFQQLLNVLEKEYMEQLLEEAKADLENECSGEDTEDENENQFHLEYTGWPDQEEYENLLDNSE